MVLSNYSNTSENLGERENLWEDAPMDFHSFLELYTQLKARIHGAILRAMAELHRVSTPKFVACNIARNIAAVESRPTTATLRATNFFVYPPSATFREIV